MVNWESECMRDECGMVRGMTVGEWLRSCRWTATGACFCRRFQPFDSRTEITMYNLDLDFDSLKRSFIGNLIILFQRNTLKCISVFPYLLRCLD